MLSIKTTISTIFAALLMLNFSSVICVADTKSNLKVGDVLTYVNRGGNTAMEKLIRITPEGNYEFQTGNRKLIMTPNMSTMTTPSGKTVIPHNGQLMLDEKKGSGAAQIGAKWQLEYAVRSIKGTLQKDRSCEVMKYEKFKTKAGTFMAYKVICSIKTVGKKGKRYSTAWYDGETLRSLWVSLGNSAKKQKLSRELVKLVRSTP